jgi:hypothetical protein
VKATIHQPHFLPWLGYFSKLVYADKFIVLDNVFFSKRKFIDRVQVINPEGKVLWIGLPIGNHYNVPCNKIHLSGKSTIATKVINNLHSSYSKARNYKNNITHIERILIESFESSDLLTEINLSIIKYIMQLLEIKMPEVFLSSQFKEVNDATDRLIMLCKETDCDTIIAGSTVGIEIHDVKKITENKISFLLQDYYNNHPVYYQTRRTQLGFAKGLSIVDCILNEGLETTKLLLMKEPILYKSQKNNV